MEITFKLNISAVTNMGLLQCISNFNGVLNYITDKLKLCTQDSSNLFNGNYKNKLFTLNRV